VRAWIARRIDRRIVDEAISYLEEGVKSPRPI
jgi:hypothetical protein